MNKEWFLVAKLVSCGNPLQVSGRQVFGPALLEEVAEFAVNIQEVTGRQFHFEMIPIDDPEAEERELELLARPIPKSHSWEVSPYLGLFN